MNFALPATIDIDPETLRLITKIDEFKGQWRVMQTLSPERLKGLRRVATIESVGSSTRIEGSRMTDREVEELLGKIDIGSFRTRDEQEVAGYAYIMEQVFAHHREIPLNQNMMLQLHRDLLQFSTKGDRHRGEYKSLPNNVATFDADGREIGIVFETSTPFDTPTHMESLLDWHRRAEADGSLHPLQRISIFVVIFLAIHPFQDGNGRLSRIITALLLLRAGYTYVPYASLEAIIEQNKEAYYLALRRTQVSWRDGKPDWSAWLHFFLRSLNAQIQRLNERTESLLQPLSVLARELAALFENSETLTMKQALGALPGNSRTALKSRFTELIEAGLISAHGKGRGAFYARKQK